MEMKDCKIKENSSSPEVLKTAPGEPKKDRYPEISFGGKASYGTLPLDFEDSEAGDKVVIKLVARIKRKTEEVTSVAGEKEKEDCRGELEILEAGFKSYDESDIRKKGYKKIESEIDETLND